MSVATRPRNGKARVMAAALAALALALSGVAAAATQSSGGGHGAQGGGGHGGGHPSAAAHGGGHAYAHGAYAGAHYARPSAYRGAGPSGYYHGGYGGHGGYAGHGGYGWRGGGYWHGHYWGAFGLGLYFATLPWYYETYWWGGVPYYYADYNFYRWNDAMAEYETVAPPADDGGGAAPAAGGELYVYPRSGQSPEQQQRDRYECYRWAADQTGFDPTHPGGGPNAQGGADQAGAYRRAESACLEGRGYTAR